MPTGRSVDQLRCYAHPVAGSPDAPFQHKSNPKFFSNTADIDGYTFVSKCGVARNYEKPRGTR